MKKIIFLLVALILCVYAKPQKSIFDLSADDVSSNGDEVIAQGNAFLLYEDTYMVAQKIIYNRATKQARLEGGAKIYYGSVLYLDAERIDVALRDKHTTIQNLYLQSPMGIWVMAKKGEGLEDRYKFKRGVISGCDIEYPLWHMNVSSGTYHTQKEYISVWNSRFYVGNIPLFYLPYFAAPTSNVRKTGLLTPEISMSNKQGFMFMQPLFIAPSNRWDMTLSPQIRTERGFGMGFEVRVADKNNQIATLHGRYFRNYDEYVLENGLKNQDIYGLAFNYETRQILSSENSNFEDGFFADITYMNDLEYMRLKSLNASFNTRLYASRINYFIDTPKQYFGTYLKYYLDLSQASNDETLQTLPQIHYHRYTDSLWSRNLLYTFDFQSRNVARTSGYGYWQNTFSLPLGITFPLLKDYLSVGGNLEFYGTSVSLNNASYIRDSLTQMSVNRRINYGVSNYNISFNTDIARRYENLFHSLHFEALFSGALYKYTSDAIDDVRYEAYNKLLETLSPAEMAIYWNPSDMVDVMKNKHKVDLKFSQYFYNNSGKELFYWRIYQRIFFKDSFLTQNQVLRNEVGFSPLDGLNLSASVFYHYVRSTISEASINASFNRWGLNSNLTYYFKLDPLYDTSPSYISQNTGFARGMVGYDFGYFNLDANVGYDVGQGYLKDWYVTISKDIRCFGIGLKFAQDIRPVLKADNSIASVSNQYVKLEFRFVPLANVGVTYRMKE